MSFKVPNRFRIRGGIHGSSNAAGKNGAFKIPCDAYHKKAELHVIASDGEGWEHVSVSVANADRTPVWAEMVAVKKLFWDDEDGAVQYHPPKENYVNQHPNCLHMWRPTNMVLPIPEEYLVGFKDDANLQNLMYRMMDVFSEEEQIERNRIANNMIDRGGSFVKKLGELMIRADPHNFQKLKQTFKNYYEEYDY